MSDERMSEFPALTFSPIQKLKKEEVQKSTLFIINAEYLVGFLTFIQNTVFLICNTNNTRSTIFGWPQKYDPFADLCITHVFWTQTMKSSYINTTRLLNILFLFLPGGLCCEATFGLRGCSLGLEKGRKKTNEKSKQVYRKC